LSDRLALNQQKLAELRELRSTDPEEQKKIQDEILQVESEVADARLSVAQNLASQRVEAEKRATDAIKKEIDSVNLNAQRQTTGVRQQQASGGISKEDAAADIAQIEASATAQSIALIQQRLAVVRQGSEEERDLTQQLADLQEQAANQEISRQEAVKQAQEAAAKERLEGIERANKAAEAAIEQSQNGEVTAVRQLQAQRIISAEEAEDRIAVIQQRGLDQQLAQTQRQIDQVTQLRADQLLSEKMPPIACWS
jgi:IgA-specific serine endopeptidase